MGRQSVSPVRETVAQSLGSLFMHMPKRSLLSTHTLLLQMARQDFTASKRPYIWQVRHGGMLGLKYEVAVRKDILMGNAAQLSSVKQGDLSQPATDGQSGFEVLRSVVTSAILGWEIINTFMRRFLTYGQIRRFR